MKRKSLTALLSGLITVSLTGVGFASWIIVSDAKTSVENGSVTVEAVEDRILKAEASISDGEVHFGPEKVQTEGWLITTSTLTKTEDLTFKFSVTITNSDYLSALKVTIENTEYATKAAAGYFTALPTITDLSSTSTSTSDDGIPAAATTASTYGVKVTKTTGEKKEENKMTFDFTVNLNWGTKFGNENPYDFYNKITSPDEEDIENAKDDLTAIYALNTNKFKVSIEAKASRA